MAVEIVDATVSSNSYTYNTKDYGVILGMEYGILKTDGSGNITIKNAAGLDVHAIGGNQYVDASLTQTYQSSYFLQNQVSPKLLIVSGDVISADGTYFELNALRILAADSLWEASLFL